MIIPRIISIVDRDNEKTYGFYEAFVLADTAFIYSLNGKGFIKNLTPKKIRETARSMNVSRIEFVMEPKIFRLIEKRDNFKIVRKLNHYDLELYWCSLEI